MSEKYVEVLQKILIAFTLKEKPIFNVLGKGKIIQLKLSGSFEGYVILWWRSGFDLKLVLRDPDIESRCRNALQGRRRDHGSQEASLILE